MHLYVPSRRANGDLIEAVTFTRRCIQAGGDAQFGKDVMESQEVFQHLMLNKKF